MVSFVTLVILDGFGYSRNDHGNAILHANAPFWKKIFNTYPSGLLLASGEAVGLPEGQMGNSEVGHMNIGAGRIVYQDIVRISKAISDGSFFKNKVIEKAIMSALNNNAKLHLIGLLSDGGVHSHIKHLFAIVEFACKKGLKDICIHAILDGRDTPPKSAMRYIENLENKLKELNCGRIATMGGRYYYMDRDKRWQRTQKAYNAMVMGKGLKAENAVEALKQAYSRGETDEFVTPVVLSPDCCMENKDAVFVFNFRADRVRQIVSAIGFDDFNGFEREKTIYPSFVGTMTLYDQTFPFEVAFPPQKLNNVIGEVIAARGLKQLRIAETEKYAHVTYFFNGGREEPFEGEDRILIPSPKVATYDMKPEMSAYEVTDRVVEEIKRGAYKLIVLNFANPDMVGHTGNFRAAVKAIESVDKCLERVVKETVANGGICIVTSDHGNAERMIDPSNGKPWTAHTTNPTPFVVIDDVKKVRIISSNREEFSIPEENLDKPVIGILADIAPTVLKLLRIPIPDDMTGNVIADYA